MAALHGLNEQLVALQFLPQVVADEVQPLVLGDRCEPTAPVSNRSSRPSAISNGDIPCFKREKTPAQGKSRDNGTSFIVNLLERPQILDERND